MICNSSVHEEFSTKYKTSCQDHRNKQNSRFESSSFNRCYCTLNNINIAKGQEIMLLKGLRHPNLRHRRNSDQPRLVTSAKLEVNGSRKLVKDFAPLTALISENKLFHRTALLQDLSGIGAGLTGQSVAFPLLISLFQAPRNQVR